MQDSQTHCDVYRDVMTNNIQTDCNWIIYIYICIMPIYRLNWIMIPIKWTSPLRVVKFRHLTIQPMMEPDANTVVWLTCPTRQEQDRGWQESIFRSDGPQQDVHSTRIKIQGLYWRKLIWYFFLKFLNSQFLQLF